jgi:hypothetical protein
LSFDDIENKRSILRKWKLYLKSKNNEPEKKKLGQMQKLVGKMWIEFQRRSKSKVNRNSLYSIISKL